MYLKALEIQGFKSFPEKTVLAFGEDITAIVGPNGSGKSNIADAIRWVMGEQSTRTLRGSKMEDVIFDGTARRKGLGFAEVTLVLDNTGHLFPSMDESEVAVTRRYYRSGESEYYINRQSVRLKDMTELFMDTGMGREGYSIVGQGRVDEILSTKSTDRREIFEEAAGISKYRHRKEEAERKLERTEENLVRINDKIAELELQVEPLRMQAETAKKYLVLRDEMRLLEISLWLENLEALKKGLPNLLKHVENITKVYGLPAVVAINAFPTDTEAELRLVEDKCRELGVHAVLSEVWAKGGEGALELADEVMRLIEQPSELKFAYEDGADVADALEAIATKVYRADGVDFTPAAKRQLAELRENGFGNLPVCVAKTQYSFSDNAKALGAPENFRITVRELKVSAGAHFVVALTGSVLTMPGLPKVPAAENIDVDNDGNITGLF